MATVLVTGGTGFLGAHTIARLLVDGHDVRTTVRSLSRGADVQKMLQEAGAPNLDGVRFFAADLTRDDGWAEAVAGVDYVVHVASPFPGSRPKNENENELIAPARDGALRVLRTARDAGANLAAARIYHPIISDEAGAPLHGVLLKNYAIVPW